MMRYTTHRDVNIYINFLNVLIPYAHYTLNEKKAYFHCMESLPYTKLCSGSSPKKT